jgi:PAS domain S-box-containing protein
MNPTDHTKNHLNPTTQEFINGIRLLLPILENAPLAIVITSSNGDIKYINPQMEVMFGYSYDELQGVIIDHLLPETLRDIHQKHRTDYTKNPYTRLMGKNLDLTGRRKTGEEFPVEIGLSYFYLRNDLQIISYITDISKRKRIEREILLLGQISRQMKDAVILTDSDSPSIVRYVNKAFTDLYGYSEKEIIGKPSWVLFAGDGADQKMILDERDDSIHILGEYRVKYQDRKKDGSKFWVSNTSSVLEIGKDRFDLGIVRDISEQVESQELLNKHNNFLAALHQSSLNILSHLDLNDVLEWIIIQTTAILNTDHGNFFLVDEERKEIECKVGVGAFNQFVGSKFKIGDGFPSMINETQKPLILDIVEWRNNCPGFYLPENITEIMGTPLRSENKLLGVLCIATDSASTMEFGEREKGMLSHFGQLATIAIQNAQLFAEVERSRLESEQQKARMDNELRIARSVQLAMLPRNFPDVKGWSFAARWKPALEVSGDYYDFIFREGNSFDLIIADVTDKGVPAALFMAHSKTLLRSSLESNASLLDGVELANKSITQENVGPYVTMFLARINPETGETVYVNAGHNPALVFQSGEDKIIKLTATGTPLGIGMDIGFEQRSLKLEKNDFIVLYTDGVSEAMDRNHNQFGEERLLDAVYAYRNSSTQEIAEHVLEKVEQYISLTQPSDDIAIVVARRL